MKSNIVTGPEGDMHLGIAWQEEAVAEEIVEKMIIEELGEK
jgi:hypothetical protein